MQSIADYFKAQLGADINDDQDLSGAWDINGPDECIVECKAAIDACAAFLAHSKAAFGEYKQAPFIAHCADIVRCYIYG